MTRLNTCGTCVHATEKGDMWVFMVPVGLDEENKVENGLWCTIRPRWDQVTCRHWCASWSPA